MSQLRFSKTILENKEELKRICNSEELLNKIINIAEKSARPNYKASAKQMYYLEQAYYPLSEILHKKEQEQKRRAALSEFERLWEDNSDYYIDTEVEWGSGRVEYITKERFEKIYKELTGRIKYLENKLNK